MIVQQHKLRSLDLHYYQIIPQKILKKKEKIGLTNNLKIMTQEVQVILTLEVDVTQSKQDIENFIKELINNHTFYSSTYNRMIYD